MLDSLDQTPPAVVDAKDKNEDGIKGSTTPSKEHSTVDKKAAGDDKDLPKAVDEPQPQTGAPSAPISE